MFVTTLPDNAFASEEITVNSRQHSARTRRPFLWTAVGIVAALTFAGQGLLAQRGGAPFKIGIIGSGKQGGTLGTLWAKAGHQVVFSSRHPEELKQLVADAGPNARAALPQEAAAFGDVVFIAVPYSALPQVGRDYAAQLKGKIVIDCSNPYPERDGAMATDARAKGTGIASAEYLPGTRLARAFNAIGSGAVQQNANRAGEKVAIPIAGDDQAAVAAATRLAQDAGFDAVVVGGLSSAKQFDPDTPVYVKNLTAKELRAALNLPPKP